MAESNLWRPIVRALRAGIVLATHGAMAAFILLGIWLLEQFIHYLWGTNDALLFDRFPIRYMFHTMDVGVIMLYIWYGLLEAGRAFREP